jgi:hypothetical protein
MSKPSDAIYLTLSQTHDDPIMSASVSGAISQTTNPLVSDASNYDMYVQHMSTSTSDLPYFNIKDQVINNDTNQTNMSISIVITDPTHVFNNPLPANDSLLFGFQVGGADVGATSWLQYQSENAYGLANPPTDGTVDPNINTSAYPYPYFDVHSIQLFLDMINNAIVRMWDQIAGINLNDNPYPYFEFDPSTQLYIFHRTVGTKVPNYDGNIVYFDLYVNGFLERYLDGFRWNYLSDSDVGDLNYIGLNNQLLYPSSYVYPVANPTEQTLISEYSCIANLVDISAIVIIAGGSSDFNYVEGQYIPLATDSVTFSTLPSTNAILRFPIDPSGFTSSTNNSSIEYNATVLDKKLVINNHTQLRNLGLTPYIQNSKNELYPITLPCTNGKFSITLVLFSK